MQWPKLIDLFLESMRLDRGASPHTLSAYATDLGQWTAHLASPPTVEDLAQTQVRLARAGAHARSLARKVSAMRQLLKFLAVEHGWAPELAESLQTPKIPARLPRTLESAEIERLLEAAAQGLPHTQLPPPLHEALRLRDQALVFVMYASGLRVSELVGLALKDIDLEAEHVRVMGKGRKERLVPLARPAGEALAAYFEIGRPWLARDSKTQHVFVNLRGAPLTRQGVWAILKKLGALAEIETEFSPHTLRHAFATHLLAGGMGLRALQQLLGHSSVATTEIYTHVGPASLKAAHRKFHPRGE